MEEREEQRQKVPEADSIREKKAYISPVLVRFGDIRELTKGTGGKTFDAVGTVPEPL